MALSLVKTVDGRLVQTTAEIALSCAKGHIHMYVKKLDAPPPSCFTCNYSDGGKTPKLIHEALETMFGEPFIITPAPINPDEYGDYICAISCNSLGLKILYTKNSKEITYIAGGVFYAPTTRSANKFQECFAAVATQNVASLSEKVAAALTTRTTVMKKRREWNIPPLGDMEYRFDD